MERTLSELEARGARGYDAPACDCARALLARAEELGSGVAALLVARAQVHVESLAERFERDKARVAARLALLDSNHEAYASLQRCMERGELLKVARSVRRISVEPRAARRLLVERIAPEDEAKPAAPTQRPPPRPARKQRAVVYEDSVAALVASFALARAVDVVPEDAGPYNPLRIASSTLDRMREVSPFFLTVQLNRLEELASLLALPELPAPPPEVKKVLPKKKSRSPKGGRS